jgi:hypothetical protein
MDNLIQRVLPLELCPFSRTGAIYQSNMRFSASIAFAAAVLFKSHVLAQNAVDKPNIVFILTDDQDVKMNSLSHMKQVQTLLMNQGLQFTKHYAHVALCCPSRATLWTGQHAHNHNVTSVVTPWGGWPKVQAVGAWNNSLSVWLNNNGYNTYYSGKLYNAHRVDNYGDGGQYAAGWTESVSLSMRALSQIDGENSNRLGRIFFSSLLPTPITTRLFNTTGAISMTSPRK